MIDVTYTILDPSGFGGQQYVYVLEDALAIAVSTSEGAEAITEVAALLGVSNAEAQRRCCKIVADMLAGRVGA